MSTCIKTGARVFLEEYNSQHAADLHLIEDAGILIIRFNTSPVSFTQVGATHRLMIEDGFVEQAGQHGTIVVPIEYLEALH